MYKFEEEWVKYGEDILPESNFRCIEILNDIHITKITLKNKHNDIAEIFFDGTMDFISSADKGARMRTWGEVQLKYGEDFLNDYCLYKVTNSTILKWLMAEGTGIYDAENYNHFCIVTSNKVVDVIVFYEPIIKFYKLIKTSTEENEEEDK